MKITETHLYTIPYEAIFKTIYQLTDKDSFILDSIKIYTLIESCMGEKVDFDIVISSKDKYIQPRYNPNKCDGFALIAEKLVHCKKIEIKKEDYITTTNNNGDFTFIIEDKTSTLVSSPGYCKNDKCIKINTNKCCFECNNFDHCTISCEIGSSLTKETYKNCKYYKY
jgi:hypothetical protein